MIEPLVLPTDAGRSAADSPPPVVVQSPLAPPVRLDLACGQSPREGFEGVDLYAPGRHAVNLLRFPWPWGDRSVDELHCSHFVEHIPTVYVAPDGSTSDIPRSAEDKDLFFAFFDECWRILKSGGVMTVIVPALRSNRAFQDPTHRRFLPAETFLYLNRVWREMNRLGHYRVDCDFTGPGGLGVPLVEGQVPMEESLRAPEVQAVRVGTLWNVVGDWRVLMSRGRSEGERT